MKPIAKIKRSYANLVSKVRRVYHARKWKRIRENGLAIDPYEFPTIYLAQIDKGFTDKDLSNRKKIICTRIPDIGEALAYIESMAHDVRYETNTNRITAPNKSGARTIRADTFLYDSKEGQYMELRSVLSRLSEAYQYLREADHDKYHSKHHRVKPFVRPVVEELHECFIEMLN